EHERFETLVNSAEKPTDAGVVTVTDISEPLLIDVLTGKQQIGSSAHVYNLLNQVCHLLLVQRCLVFHVARARNWTIREQRHHASVPQRDGFSQEFFAIPKFGVLPIPMPPDDRGKRSLAAGNNKISRHASAFRAGIGNVMHSNATLLFKASFSDVERRVPVIIETMNDVSVLGCCNRADQEAHDDKPDNHECRSGSAIKVSTKDNTFVFYSLSWHTRKDRGEAEFSSAPSSAANMQPEKINFFPRFPMTYFASTSDPKLICKSPSQLIPANKNFGDH